MTSASPIGILFGTRPEAIKLAPVIVALRARGAARRSSSRPASTATSSARCSTCSTSAPDHDLALMRENQSLDHVLSSVVTGVGSLLAAARPRALRRPGRHDEHAGRRRSPRSTTACRSATSRPACAPATWTLPFPEEMNRRATSIVARWHFAPTDGAAENLRREGVDDGVHVTGNTVVDALHHIGGRSRGRTTRSSPASRRTARSSWPPRTAASRGTAASSASRVALRDVLDELGRPSARVRDPPEPGRERAGARGPRQRPARSGGHRARLSGASSRSSAMRGWRSPTPVACRKRVPTLGSRSS